MFLLFMNFLFYQVFVLSVSYSVLLGRYSITNFSSSLSFLPSPFLPLPLFKCTQWLLQIDFRQFDINLGVYLFGLGRQPSCLRFKDIAGGYHPFFKAQPGISKVLVCFFLVFLSHDEFFGSFVHLESGLVYCNSIFSFASCNWYWLYEILLLQLLPYTCLRPNAR